MTPPTDDKDLADDPKALGDDLGELRGDGAGKCHKPTVPSHNATVVQTWELSVFRTFSATAGVTPVESCRVLHIADNEAMGLHIERKKGLLSGSFEAL